MDGKKKDVIYNAFAKQIVQKHKSECLRKTAFFMVDAKRFGIFQINRIDEFNRKQK